MPDPIAPKPVLDAAEYTLEHPVLCPHCRVEINLVQVVRLLRTKVAFVSALPRRGHVVVCPECHCVLSTELGGM